MTQVDAAAPSVGIRPARPDDAQRLHALATQVFLETYATDGISEALAQEVEAQCSRAVFERDLADPRMHLVVAERSDHLLAYAHLVVGTGHARVPGPATSELLRLYVQSPALRHGLGTRLLQHAERRAAEAGSRTLWLTAWVGNARARAFYVACAYRDLGATDHAFGGRHVENRLYARRLDLAR
ncbi:MAG: GNAT family N-acetyltransferase [Burkholderiaceae bacterium]